MVKVIIVHCLDLGRDGQAQVLNLGSKKRRISGGTHKILVILKMFLTQRCCR